MDRQSQPLRGTRGLVVDDSAFAAQLRRMVQRWGAEVDTAASVAAAKTLLATKAYDWVTLDYDLGNPQETGADLARWMREHHPATVRIACSASTMQFTTVIATDAAAEPVQPLYHARLDKPFSAEMLARTIIESLAR